MEINLVGQREEVDEVNWELNKGMAGQVVASSNRLRTSHPEIRIKIGFLGKI